MKQICAPLTALLLLVHSGEPHLRTVLATSDSEIRHLRQKSDDTNGTQSADTYIVGGVPAATGEFPWFVSPLTGPVLCGGSLIRPDVVLTAAHCRDAFPVRGTVNIGAILLGSVTVGNPQQRSITRVLVHPFYDANHGLYDLLIFKLDRPVTRVRPLELNRNNFFPTSTDPLVVMGFGRTEYEGETSPFLQKTYIQAKSFRTCENSYARVASLDQTEPLILDEQAQLCAGYPVDGAGACQGDSGGPLVSLDDGRQVGVVSIGVSCADASFPGLYARVSGATDFLDIGLCLLTNFPHPDYCN